MPSPLGVPPAESWFWVRTEEYLIQPDCSSDDAESSIAFALAPFVGRGASDNKGAIAAEVYWIVSQFEVLE